MATEGSALALEALASGEVSLEELPIRLQAIAATLGWLYYANGFSKAEIARSFEKSRPWVSARLLELETELKTRILELRRDVAA